MVSPTPNSSKLSIAGNSIIVELVYRGGGGAGNFHSAVKALTYMAVLDGKIAGGRFISVHNVEIKRHEDMACGLTFTIKDILQ